MFAIFLVILDAEDVVQFDQSAVFSAEDNVQTGDVACVTLNIVEDDILESTMLLLVLFRISPHVTEPQDSPDFTRVFIVDTTSQGMVSPVNALRSMPGIKIACRFTKSCVLVNRSSILNGIYIQ